MKNILLMITVSVVSLATVANAVETTKKAQRKPAQVSGTITYSGPVLPTSKVAGPVTISGDVAQHIYDGMTGVTTSTDPGAERIGRGIVCRLNTDEAAHAVCTMDFDDITQGVISPTGPWAWAPTN